MKHPLKTLIFRPISGMWTEIGNNAGLLSDYLAERSLLIDDRTQFARIYDYDAGVLYMYRATAGKVSIEEWKIGD